jgi:DNA-binding MarR family transcriptional regulator
LISAPKYRAVLEIGVIDTSGSGTAKQQIAQKILDIIPLVMRVMSSEMRQGKSVIAVAHVPILGMLSQRAYTLSELAERSAVSAPTMSNTISTMEQHGWVERQRDTQDRRVVWIALTAAGLATYHGIYQHTVDRVAALLGSLSTEDEVSLINGLTVLQSVFIQEMERDPSLRRV